MPTWLKLPGFQREYDKLQPHEEEAFKLAVRHLVEDLRGGTGFRRGLRIKKMAGYDHIWELTWAPDGRATFEYGPQQVPGEQHIIWRRIGGHEIFRQP